MRNFEYKPISSKKDDPQRYLDPVGWEYAWKDGYRECTDNVWRNDRGERMGMENVKNPIDLKVKYHEYIIWEALHGKDETEEQSGETPEIKKGVSRVRRRRIEIGLEEGSSRKE